MDFTFDAEQLALQEVARRAMEAIGGDDVRRLADDPVGFDCLLYTSPSPRD